jgi:hypothetical protein
LNKLRRRGPTCGAAMKWRVEGANKQTGQDVTVIVDADTQEAAEWQVSEHVVVSGVRPDVPPPPAQPLPYASPPVPGTEARPGRITSLSWRLRAADIGFMMLAAAASLWGLREALMTARLARALNQPLMLLDSLLYLALGGGAGAVLLGIGACMRLWAKVVTRRIGEGED